MSHVERRRNRRFVVVEEILVVVDGDSATDSGTLVNIGESGCYVASRANFVPGERVNVLVHIPEGSGYSLRFTSMVAWRNSGQIATAQEGFGLEFLHNSRTRANVAKLLDVLESRQALVKLVPQ